MRPVAVSDLAVVGGRFGAFFVDGDQRLVDHRVHHADANAPDLGPVAVQRLLTVVEHSVNLRYPASAKYLLDRSSRLEFRAISRWKPEAIGDHEGLPLQQLADYVRDLDLPEAALSRGR